MMNFVFPGFILAAFAAILWGTAGTAQTFITSPSLSPLWVGALRLVCACLFFYPMLAISQRQLQPSNASAKGEDHYLLKVIAAGCCMAMFNLRLLHGHV